MASVTGRARTPPVRGLGSRWPHRPGFASCPAAHPRSPNPTPLPLPECSAFEGHEPGSKVGEVAQERRWGAVGSSRHTPRSCGRCPLAFPGRRGRRGLQTTGHSHGVVVLVTPGPRTWHAASGPLPVRHLSSRAPSRGRVSPGPTCPRSPGRGSWGLPFPACPSQRPAQTDAGWVCFRARWRTSGPTDLEGPQHAVTASPPPP